MQHTIERLASALRSVVTRGKVTGAAVGGRTLLQITGLDGEVKQSVELLLPPGYTAAPAAGADIVLLPVLGSRDHLVALGGDAVGQATPDLAPGDFGLRHASGRQVILRTGWTEITDPVKVKVMAPLLECSGNITAAGTITAGVPVT